MTAPATTAVPSTEPTADTTGPESPTTAERALPQEPAGDPDANSGTQGGVGLVGTRRDLELYDPVKKVMRIPTSIPGLTLEFTDGQLALTEEQMHWLKPLGIEATWDAAQVAIFLYQCWVKGYDPWDGQAYLMKIQGKYVKHTGIKGLLGKAEDSGEYRGLVGPQWCGPDGRWLDIWPDRTTAPVAARCGVLRAGFDAPLWATIMYDEYAPLDDEWVDDPNGVRQADGRIRRVKTGRKVIRQNWRPAGEGGKPAQFLGKCSKAAALRDAFPTRCGGFYLREETERSRAEDVRAPQDDPAATRRQEAYEQAMAEAEQAGPPPVFVGLGVPDEQARTWLVAELDEQGLILGKTRGEMTARWIAARGGLELGQWPLPEVAKLVHTIRRYVLETLRQAGRDAEADQYQKAPPVADCRTLFGRAPQVVESTVKDTPQQPAAGDD